jgi:hypothetical protein
MDELAKKIKELKAEYNRLLIYDALKFNESVYNQLVFDHGMQWVSKYFLNDSGIEYAVAKSVLFWKWWKNQWELRDAQFVFEANLKQQERPLNGDCLMIALELYYEAHNPTELNIHPNRFVLEEIKKNLLAFMEEEKTRLKQLLNGK